MKFVEIRKKNLYYTPNNVLTYSFYKDIATENNLIHNHHDVILNIKCT